MRRAVNFAVDRAALARNAGAGFSGLPTDQYLPPAMPGFRDADIYPLGGPDVARARSLAGAHGASRGDVHVQHRRLPERRPRPSRPDLRAIGITVEIKQFPYALMFDRQVDPRRALRHRLCSDGSPTTPTRRSSSTRRSPGSRSTSPAPTPGATDSASPPSPNSAGDQRLRAYGHLDIDLATHVAPVVAFADVTARDFFSARIGCQTYQPFYGMDLGDLCIRRQ